MTRNEPAQLSIKEAIEEAVVHLTVQGIKDNSWALANPKDWESPIIQRYLREDANYVNGIEALYDEPATASATS